MRINWDNFACDALHCVFCFDVEGALDNGPYTGNSDAVVNEQARAKPQQVTDSTAEQVEGSGPQVNVAAVTVPAQTSADTETLESVKIQEVSEQGVVNGSETKCLDVTSDVVADIDADDPGLNKAASVIQASFRTYLKKKVTEEGQVETQTEPLEASGDAEPQEDTELNSEGEKEVSVSQTEAHEDEPESGDSVDPEMTITHSASQGDVIHEDKEGGTKSQSLLDEEQQVHVEETKEEGSKSIETQSPTQQQVHAKEIEEEGPKENETQPPTQNEEQPVEETEGQGAEEEEPQHSMQDESEPLPEESKKEDVNSELTSTLQSQDMARDETPEGTAMEDKTVPTGGVEQGAAEVLFFGCSCVYILCISG